eukprot:6107706-Pyramimonas_sp.AAC.1
MNAQHIIITLVLLLSKTYEQLALNSELEDACAIVSHTHRGHYLYRYTVFGLITHRGLPTTVGGDIH